MSNWNETQYIDSWSIEFASDIVGLELIFRERGFKDFDYWGGETFFIALDLLEHFYQIVFLNPFPLTTHPFAWTRLQFLRSWVLSKQVFRPDILTLPLLMEEQKKNILREIGLAYIWQGPWVEEMVPKNVKSFVGQLWEKVENFLEGYRILNSKKLVFQMHGK